MANRVSAEATTEFRGKLDELLVAVDERLELDMKFECAGPGCGSPELSRHYNRLFGRTLLACYEFELVDEVGRHLQWLAGVMGRRGFGPAFFGRMLEAWDVAMVSILPRSAALELAGPIDDLRRNLGVLVESAQAEPQLDAGPARFVQLLLGRERRAAAEAALGRKTPVAGIVAELVLPALQHIGRLWETGRIGVADEHAATEICRYVLYRLFDSVEPAPDNGRKALVACVPGEEHELGAELAAEYLRLKGWGVFAVGRSAPEEDIVATVSRDQPDVAFFSVTMIANLPAAMHLTDAALAAEPELGVVLGGRAAELAAQKLARPRVVVVMRFDAADEAGRGLAGRDA
jgi:MerR family transcriptional regulator, light-induced transcriptional regulator